jgi:hypothetical protein
VEDNLGLRLVLGSGILPYRVILTRFTSGITCISVGRGGGKNMALLTGVSCNENIENAHKSVFFVYIVIVKRE